MLRPELWVQRLSAEDVVRELLETVPTPAAERRQPAARRNDPHGVAALAAYAALAALGLLAALALRRPELAVLAAPFAARARARAARSTRAAGRRRLARRSSASARSRATRSRSSSTLAPARAGRAARARCSSLPDGLEVVDGRRARSLRLGWRGGAHARAAAALRPLGQLPARRRPAARAATGSGSSPGSSSSTGRRALRVYPRPETLRQLVPPVATQPFAGNQVARAEGRRARVRRPARVRARRPRALDQLARERARATSSSSTSATRSGTPT